METGGAKHASRGHNQGNMTSASSMHPARRGTSLMGVNAGRLPPHMLAGIPGEQRSKRRAFTDSNGDVICFCHMSLCCFPLMWAALGDAAVAPQSQIHGPTHVCDVAFLPCEQMDTSPLVRKTMAKFLGEAAQAESSATTLQHAAQRYYNLILSSNFCLAKTFPKLGMKRAF
eukprot:1161845-Pelagomonas_calceolata.AAC.2